MEIIVFSIVVALTLFIQYLFYLNPQKLVRLRNKLSRNKRYTEPFQLSSEKQFVEDADMLKRRFKLKMIIVFSIYVIVVVGFLMKW